MAGRLACMQILYCHISSVRLSTIYTQGERGTMDLDHLQSILDNLQLTTDSVHSAAQYCVNNNVGSEVEIVKMVDKHFSHPNADIHAKTAIFLFISDIFYLANIKKARGFFKHFAGKLKPYVQVLSTEVTENVQLASWIIGALDKWAEQEYYVQSFLEKVREGARPLLKILEEEKQGQNDKFSKYKKTFLMDVLDVREFEPTNQLYKAHVTMQELTNKINSFNMVYNKLHLDQNDEDTLKRAAELLRTAEELPERLEKAICMQHECFGLLTKECREDLKQLSRATTD